MFRITRGALLLALLLLVAACGDDSDSAELPLVGDDVPPAAGACLEGTEDCNDTLFPGDEPTDLPPPATDDEPIEGTPLGVADALEVSGTIVVSGFYVDTGSGPMLCEALAESYPPQCGGASLPMADASAIDPDGIQTAQGTSWTDELVTVVGEIVDGTLVPTPIST